MATRVEGWNIPLEEEARRLTRAGASISVTSAEAADLRALAAGAYAPLVGFMTADERGSSMEAMRLPDGTLWPIPICLGLPDGTETRGDALAVQDETGELCGVIEVTEVYERDRELEAKLVYGTAEQAHPGVARLLASPSRAVAGPVRALPRRTDDPVGRFALSPAETRAAIVERGWREVVGFQTRNPIHRAHEYLIKCALELCDGALLHPIVGPTKADDVPAPLRMRAYQAALEYFPAERVLLAALPVPMRYGGPREALLHALVRRNHGCTHFIVGRDHAGVGSYYRPFEAQELLRSLPSEDLGIMPLCFDDAFWCSRCDAMSTRKTCPHDADAHLSLSGTQVRAMLTAGRTPPPQLTRPEVAAELMAGRDGEGRG